VVSLLASRRNHARRFSFCCIVDAFGRQLKMGQLQKMDLQAVGESLQLADGEPARALAGLLPGD
jgi:hypothetical protein